MSNQFSDAFNAIFYRSPEQKRKDKRRWILISIVILAILALAVVGIVALCKWIF